MRVWWTSTSFILAPGLRSDTSKPTELSTEFWSISQNALISRRIGFFSPERRDSSERHVRVIAAMWYCLKRVKIYHERSGRVFCFEFNLAISESLCERCIIITEKYVRHHFKWHRIAENDSAFIKLIHNHSTTSSMLH